MGLNSKYIEKNPEKVKQAMLDRGVYKCKKEADFIIDYIVHSIKAKKLLNIYLEKFNEEENKYNKLESLYRTKKITKEDYDKKWEEIFTQNITKESWDNYYQFEINIK